MNARFLDRAAQAAYIAEKYNLPVSPKTLQKFATTGGGPKYQVFGSRAVSTPEWLDEWVQSKLANPRSSTSGAQ